MPNSVVLLYSLTAQVENFHQCLALDAAAEQENFVDSVTYSLAEAWVFYQDTRPFAIYEDDTIIGFVSLYVGEENHQIINFLIDGAFQGRGLGTQAAGLCIDLLKKEYGAGRVSVPVELGNAAARRFWGKLGFSCSDNVENGYVFMRLDLT